MDELEEKVRTANREYHDEIDPDTYDANKSIFNDERQNSIRNRLETMSEAGKRLLDVGCGTGNIVRMADDYFEEILGVDISRNMLRQAVRSRHDGSLFAQSDGTRLPFSAESFDAVSFYAILHHFPDPVKFLREGARVLREGGYLYTDHDPNYYLVRFYFPLFKFLYRNQPGFGSEKGDWAEYFHTKRPGIDPEALAGELRELGFRDVNVRYYQTENRDLSTFKSLVLKVLRPLSEAAPLKSFFTHFSIFARK